MYQTLSEVWLINNNSRLMELRQICHIFLDHWIMYYRLEVKSLITLKVSLVQMSARLLSTMIICWICRRSHKITWSVSRYILLKRWSTCWCRTSMKPICNGYYQNETHVSFKVNILNGMHEEYRKMPLEDVSGS